MRSAEEQERHAETQSNSIPLAVDARPVEEPPSNLYIKSPRVALQSCISSTPSLLAEVLDTFERMRSLVLADKTSDEGGCTGQQTNFRSDNACPNSNCVGEECIGFFPGFAGRS